MDVLLARKIQHKQLLLQVSQKLGDADLGDLKYLCADIVGESALGDVRSSTDLFTLLQYHGHLALGSYNFLSRVLAAIGRHDLASLLPESEESIVECCGGTPPLNNDCELKHRMLLVAVAEKMRREDIVKLMYVTSGKVRVPDNGVKVTGDAIGALQVLAGLEQSNLLCCSSYSVLCDLLQQIGRSDLADLIIGFPRNIQQGFTMKNQALGLMMEVLRNRRKDYIFHRERLGRIMDGNNDVMKFIHSLLLGACVKSLETRVTPNGTGSAIRTLQSAFESQYRFLQYTCTVSDSDSPCMEHKESMNFVNATFDSVSNHKTVESHICPVADSAHQARQFILEVSCEIIGKEKATKVYQLNDRIENGINVCSGYGKHVCCLLSSLASLLSSVSSKQINIDCYRKELTDIFVTHSKYLIGTFPSLAPFIQSGSLEELSKVSLAELSQRTTLPSNLNNSFTGLVAMVTVPSYAILLNLLSTMNGQVNSEEVLGNLVDYVRQSSHFSGIREFVPKCAAALNDHIACFRQDVIELDELCAPLITELINPCREVL